MNSTIKRTQCLYFGVVLSLALAAAPALADRDRDAFDGVYSGATMGYGSLENRYRFERNDDVVDLIDRSSADGFRQGVFLGSGRFFDRTYIGVEGEVGLGTHDHRAVFDSMTRMFQSEVDSSYGLGLRLGYLWSPRTLLYGQAGWQRTRMDYQFDGSDSSATGRENLEGYRLSLGTELTLQSDIFFRFDYSFTTYNEEQVDLGDGDRIYLDPTENLFRVGVGYRF